MPSIRQVAASIGKSHTAINKAIKNGRIPARAYVVSGGKVDIVDLALVKEVMEVSKYAGAEQRAPAKATPQGTSAKSRPKPNSSGAKPTTKLSDVPQENEKNSQPSDYHKIKSTKEGLQAQLLHQKLKTLSGELVKRAEVEHEFFSKARQLRDAILNVPSRLAPVLADMTDPFEIDQFLSKELKEVLSSLAAIPEVNSAG